MIGKEWAQDVINLKSKKSSTGKGMERREANTPINWAKGHTKIILNKAIPYLWILSDRSMTLINPLNRTCGAI